jgi:hypothetical protein
LSSQRSIAVIYKEIGENDGFVITAFLPSEVRIDKEVVLWEKKS